MQHLLDIENLSLSLDKKRILSGISLSITSGSFTCITGPNGSGKTTLMKGIAGLLTPESGRILLEGNDTRSLGAKKIARKVAYVPQDTVIDFEFRAIDIVMMGRSPHIGRFSTESRRDCEIARESMELTGTWELRDKSIKGMSGGERQRVMVARALAQEPKLLLLDEPTSSLDIHHQIELLDVLKELSKSRGMAIAAAIHDLNLAVQYGDKALLLDKGSMYAWGEPESVLSRENVSKVYGVDIYIIENPLTGKPHIIPFKKRAANSL